MVLYWASGIPPRSPLHTHRTWPATRPVWPRTHHTHTTCGHTLCAGAFEGLDTGQRLPDDCDMIDLQAIQRLEVCVCKRVTHTTCQPLCKGSRNTVSHPQARFGAGKPHDSERLGDGNSVVGRGPDGPLTDASPFANGRPVGVPWQDTEPLDFTDQELWDEVRGKPKQRYRFASLKRPVSAACSGTSGDCATVHTPHFRWGRSFQ